MFGPMPVEALIRIHGDPEHPVPGASRGRHARRAAVRGRLGVRRGRRPGLRLAAAGRRSRRQLGGALGRPAAEHGAIAQLDAAFALFAVLGIAPVPEAAMAVSAHARGLVEAMGPWSSGRTYLNFAEEPTDTATGYRPDAYRVLRAIRGQVDPDGLFHANHTIQGA